MQIKLSRVRVAKYYLYPNSGGASSELTWTLVHENNSMNTRSEENAMADSYEGRLSDLYRNYQHLYLIVWNNL